MEANAIHVTASPVRCPFCHDDLELGAEWVACGVCLARHHTDCWQEGNACASCKAALPLAPTRRTIRIEPDDARRSQRRAKAKRRRWILGVMTAALAIVSAGALGFIVITAEGPQIAPFVTTIF
ncbi:MAG TPA: RING finger protein [Planctomycetota bacterium]|nr:RING finger protein [Planctomycetota bacterium]